jgi:hypothetical protein
MARLARVAVSGLPHHITQIGNHWEPVFLNDGNYVADLDLISKAASFSVTVTPCARRCRASIFAPRSHWI